MELSKVYMLAAAALVAIGLFAILRTNHVVRQLLGINLLGNGIFLLLIAIAQAPADAPEEGLDPVPQAMVLTGIVVAVCATGFALTLIERYRAVSGCLTVKEGADAD